MLSREALVASMPLTEILDNASLYLVPVQNTPLSELVKATRSDDNFSVARSNGTDFDISVSDIDFIANKKDDVIGVSPHDATADQLIEVATNAVREHMLFAKTVVGPAAADLAERVQLGLREITPSSLTGAEVIVWSPPAPLSHPALSESARRFEDTPADIPALVMNMPDMAVSDIVELMLSGNTELDQEIRQWLAAKGEDWLAALWRGVFQQVQSKLNSNGVNSFIDFTGDKVDGIDNTLAIFLIARKLVDDPLDGVQMSLAAYERTAVEFRNQAGYRLCNFVLKDIDRAKANKFLVISSVGTKVTVNGSVYVEWIENGGENDVLFGNALKGGGRISVGDLDANKNELLAAWNRHVGLLGVVENNRRFNRIKELLEKSFVKQLNEVTETDDASTANKMSIVECFRELLSHVREDEVSDIYSLCLRLTCRARFPQTDAWSILSGIERIKRDNPAVDIREAAAMAMIEYVTSWVSQQFTVVAV